MYVVVVDFKIKPERLAEFMPLMLENARASRETEPGCRQFDASAHFKRFDPAVAPMVAAKAVRTLERL